MAQTLQLQEGHIAQKHAMGLLDQERRMTNYCDIGERQEGLLSFTTNTSITSESSPYSYPSDFEQMQRQPARDRDVDMEDNTVKLSNSEHRGTDEAIRHPHQSKTTSGIMT